MKKIQSNQEFNAFCTNNQIVFKLPKETSEKYYFLLSFSGAEVETGLSTSYTKIDQNWELISDYLDTNGEIMFVFEIWANNTPGINLPGSVGHEHLGKRLEISLNQIQRVIKQFVSYNDPQSIWYHEKIRKAKILNKYVDKLI